MELDYSKRIKKLISNAYAPANAQDYDVKFTTTQVYQDLCSIIPMNAFDEFDVVETLEDMGFSPDYETKENEHTNEPFDDLSYFWYMKKK